MADDKTKEAHAGTPERVAVDLLKLVAFAESKADTSNREWIAKETGRKYILDTYVECLLAARGVRRE